MRAMILDGPKKPLRPADVPQPVPGPGEVLVRVRACGVCRTDLHVVDGDLAEPKLPLIPGHQVVGTVEAAGPARPGGGEGAPRRGGFAVGQRIGIPWLGGSCGGCDYCREGRENLCGHARYTGYQADGGFAEFCAADERFCFPLPEGYPDLQAAPLLCAGLIGYRALRMAGDAQRIGFYGFGASAHILAQAAKYQGRKIYAFTRPGDAAGQEFARRLGADWAGSSDEPPPEPLQAAIIFAPAGELVPAALRAVARGGTVVCAGIHMSDIPAFPYSILWGERVVRSVANLTRQDGQEFLALAPRAGVRSVVQPYPLEKANEALADLRAGRLTGAAVLVVDPRAAQ
ncbi:MAG: zinc-dependent alcohol dehydrogenase family protein [Planctomycetes bacterium]|nr:zinc-dependent alcohol dehydrogenase family protein [Planctomycetota bacterium]